MSKIKISKGQSYPLGSSWDGKGVNFALFSAHAEKVELCLFDSFGIHETLRVCLLENEHGIWHTYLEGVEPGQVYGWRVYGPYAPLEGKRFNPNKLLLDPYAKKIVGKLIWHKAIFGYDIDSPDQDLSFSELDSAPYVPKSVVTSDDFDWTDDVKPNYAFQDTVIYELHTKGFTVTHPKVPDMYRGKFKGLATKMVMRYLKWLGVTTLELLPIHYFAGDVLGKNIKNYWGYETLNFFTPDGLYLSGGDVKDLKETVKALHQNGLEVILDVVYNHTGEGNQLGPTLCYRGIDNETYYILDKNNKRFYYDSTGCGASFNVENPNVLALVMDSLRYFASEVHVDGFRFDLASSLSRVQTQFSQQSGFLYALQQDEILRSLKLIAEPWDTVAGGYQIGAFPTSWGEWNDRFRDVVRRFWRGDERQIGEFASRVAGSSDIFGYNNRNLWSSINFVTAHDGFNLHDLLSYNQKHNEVNGEGNRDGNDMNWSWNAGVEGRAKEPSVLQNRMLRAKALMTTLLLSFGTPMLVAGDEFLNTSFGNNNPYCQDNVFSWLVWEAIRPADKNFIRYVRRLIKLRQKLEVFHRMQFFQGNKISDTDFKDLAWYKEDGNEFTAADWNNDKRRSIAYLAYAPQRLLLVVFNAEAQTKIWKLPALKKTKKWRLLVDSSAQFDTQTPLGQGKKIELPAWSVLAFEITI